MYNVFIAIILISFLIRSIRNTLYQVFLWQLKEYRIDRMIAHLKTTQGKRLILGPVTLIKWAFFAAFLFSVLSAWLFEVQFSLIGGMAIFGFVLVWIFEAILNIRELFISKWKVPRFTLKIFGILAGLLGILLFLYFFTIGFFGTTLFLPILLDKLIAPSIAILMLLFNATAYIYRKWMIEKAIRKIRKFKELKVIGITGSYGKTSTKEFLATILSEKYKVAKTPASQGTDIGIARYILRKLRSEYEVFVVEMGAYKIGEIKELCEMVHPQVGIITGINEQHQELFGSLENTMRAKYELIESLPKVGLAIFNADNPGCREMARWAEGKELRIKNYELRELESVKVYSDRVDFIYKKKKMSAYVLGEHFLENILGDIKVAENLGLTLEQIARGVAKITPADKTMKPYPGPNGSTLIDDTFNANPDGILAALEYLKVYKGKKILVMAPMIELGEKSGELHREIGKRARGVCDMVIFTNFQYNEEFREGYGYTKEDTKNFFIHTPAIVVRELKKILQKNDAVVFESKETKKILDKLKVT